MGANSQQGWALLLFVVGFTFFVGGLFALGPIFTIVGLVGLIVSWDLVLPHQTARERSAGAGWRPDQREASQLAGAQNRSQFEGGQMKILGLLVCVLGWFIAVLSVKVPGVYAQLLVAAAGFVVAVVGAVGILNSAHLKDAIWKA